MVWDAALWGIVALSMKVALAAMALSIVPAILIARLLAGRPFRGKSVVSALVHLPIVLPPVVTGYLLLLTFGRQGWIGSTLDRLGLGVSFSWVGAAIAAAVMAFPLIVRPIRLAFESEPAGLSDMAAILGAGRARRFLTVALPLAVPGIVAGSVLGFAKALGEFGATITFVSNIPGETQTLSLAVYALLQRPDGDSAALTLIAISVAISFVAVLASELFVAAQVRRAQR